MGYRFVPGYDRVQGMSMFKFFFLPYLQGHVLLRCRNFATMVT